MGSGSLFGVIKNVLELDSCSGYIVNILKPLNNIF